MMYSLNINLLQRRDASQSDEVKELPNLKAPRISAKVECIRGFLRVFGQLEQVIQVNFIGCIRGFRRLFERINRVIRAYLGNSVEPNADPEKDLEQSIIDMQEELVEMRSTVARAIATQKRIEQQYNQVQSVAQTWQQWEQSASKQSAEKRSLQILQINFLQGRRNDQLSLEDRQEAYLTKNNSSATVKCPSENSAQKASIPQQTNPERRHNLKFQLYQQTALVDKLKRDLIVLESKISESKTKKDLFKAQAAATKATELLQNTLGQLDYSSVKLAFQLIEEKVLQMEASVEDREMLMQLFEAPWETAIRRLDKALAAKTVQVIEVRSQTRLQAMAALICWKQERATWKYHFLYRLILDRQEDLSQLHQLVDRAIVDRAIEAIAAQKRNELHYHQVQRVAIRWKERAHESLERGDENWASECLMRKNNFMKIASALKTKLDEQTPLVDEVRQNLKEWDNQISDDEQTHLAYELKQKLNNLENKIAESGILYHGVIDSLKTQTSEYEMSSGEFSFCRFLKVVFHLADRYSS